MDRLQPDKAECFVSVFKAGALSRIGHDVLLKFETMALTLDDEGAMTAEFRVGSLVVVAALVDGRQQPHMLSPKDKRDIADNIGKVLEPGRFATATFKSESSEATDNGYRIRGALTLHGVTRTIDVRGVRRDGAIVATVVLRQPDYGLKPFKAFLGALKIKPEVSVEIRVPEAAA